MPININNYETYILDYIEDALAPELKQEMRTFLDKHPTIMEEVSLLMIDMPIVQPDLSITYNNKHQLKKEVAAGTAKVAWFSSNTVKLFMRAAAIILLIGAWSIFLINNDSQQNNGSELSKQTKTDKVLQEQIQTTKIVPAANDALATTPLINNTKNTDAAYASNSATENQAGSVDINATLVAKSATESSSSNRLSENLTKQAPKLQVNKVASTKNVNKKNDVNSVTITNSLVPANTTKVVNEKNNVVSTTNNIYEQKNIHKYNNVKDGIKHASSLSLIPAKPHEVLTKYSFVGEGAIASIQPLSPRTIAAPLPSANIIPRSNKTKLVAAKIINKVLSNNQDIDNELFENNKFNQWIAQIPDPLLPEILDEL